MKYLLDLLAFLIILHLPLVEEFLGRFVEGSHFDCSFFFYFFFFYFLVFKFFIIFFFLDFNYFFNIFFGFFFLRLFIIFYFFIEFFFYLFILTYENLKNISDIFKLKKGNNESIRKKIN